MVGASPTMLDWPTARNSRSNDVVGVTHLVLDCHWACNPNPQRGPSRTKGQQLRAFSRSNSRHPSLQPYTYSRTSNAIPTLKPLPTAVICLQ